jgi:hypothetical protein
MKYRLRATIFMNVAYSTRTVGIVVASAIAVVLIVAAVLISGPLPFHLNRANATSTHDLLASYAAKDTDGDALPDWEEALYGTDPNNAHSFQAGVTDGDAVARGLIKPEFASATSTPVDINSIPGSTPAADTITDSFSRSFFESYLRSRTSTTPPTSEELVAFVESQLNTLEQGRASAPAYTASRVRVSGAGSDAAIAYAAAVEKILTSPSVPYTKNELTYYSDAVLQDDAQALKAVQVIAKGYTDASRDVLGLPVPIEEQSAHLHLANALSAMGAVLTDMAALNTDPLRAMLGIGRYEAAHQQLTNAFIELTRALASSGATFTDGDPGFRLSTFGTVPTP